MYEIINYENEKLVGSGVLSVKYKYKEETITFNLSKVIFKHKSEELPLTYLLFNQFLDYKGEDFKKKLFLKLKTIYQIFSSYDASYMSAPITNLHDILDMFPQDEIENWLATTNIRPPSNMQAVFKEEIAQDQKGTRIQTYLKNDYMQLIAASLRLKSILGPLCHYIYVRPDINKKKELELITLIIDHDMMKSEAIVKLIDIIDLISKKAVEKDPFIIAKRQIELDTSADNLKDYILGLTLIQRIATASIVKDNVSGNIVTSFNIFIKQKIAPKADASKTIRSKEPGSTGDGDVIPESKLESLRLHSNITQAMMVEMQTAAHSLEMILHQYKVIDPNGVYKHLTPECMDLGKRIVKQMDCSTITLEQVQLLAVIFKDLIPAKGINYLGLNHIENLITVGFAYLWNIGYKPLAVFLISMVKDISTDFKFNSYVNRMRLSTELKEKLIRIYPNYTGKLDNRKYSIIIWLNKFIADVYGTNYNRDYLTQDLKDVLESVVVTPTNLNNVVAEFLYTHEEMRIQKRKTITKGEK